MTSQAFLFPNTLEEVDPMVVSLRSVVEGTLENEALFRFEICMSEALSNLVLHAEAAATDAPTEITLSKAKERIDVEILDPVGTAPFDLREQAKDLSDVDVLAENGRGLGLILECSDGLEYKFAGRRNRLSLNFRNRQKQG